MKKPFLLVTLLCVFLSVGLGLVFSGVISYRQAGICFGMCEQDRRDEFDRFFPEWFAREGECGPRGAEDRSLIAFLHPDLIPNIDAKNQSFSALSVQEKNDTLSLGDRNQYLDDPWRVILRDTTEYNFRDFRSVIPPEMPYEANSTWVRECPEHGLIRGSYCEGFVSVSISTTSPRTRYFGSLYLNEKAYSHLREAGEVENFITQMKTDSWRDYDLQRDAENQVQAMPASDFPLESSPLYDLTIESRVEQIYLQSKCD